MSNVMPAMSGITDYFDMTSLDVEGGVGRACDTGAADDVHRHKKAYP